MCTFLFSSCLEKRIYIRKTTYETVKGDTIVSYGGQLKLYSNGVVKLDVEMSRHDFGE